jgi:hypothetical protein
MDPGDDWAFERQQPVRCQEKGEQGQATYLGEGPHRKLAMLHQRKNKLQSSF